MSTPKELLEGSGLYKKAAIEETSPHLKALLDSHALALELLADKLSRGKVEQIKEADNAMVSV
jgi:hypothetical protein